MPISRLLSACPTRCADAIAARSRASATIKAYRSDLRDFSAWCASQGALEPLPAIPETVSAYLAHLADRGLSASTVSRRLAAISYAHRQAGLVVNSAGLGSAPEVWVRAPCPTASRDQLCALATK